MVVAGAHEPPKFAVFGGSWAPGSSKAIDYSYLHIWNRKRVHATHTIALSLTEIILPTERLSEWFNFCSHLLSSSTSCRAIHNEIYTWYSVFEISFFFLFEALSNQKPGPHGWVLFV